MRSVIDEIAAAEQRAEEIRIAAAADARESTLKARDDAQKALSRLELEERERMQAQLEEARLEGEQLSGELLEQMERDADALCERANERLGNAVAYIVDKVTKTA
ncbi:MAG: hypothetical protein GX417_12095 [Clostridiales bacterium]|nr:hypothetical protein [Clostridiales bacterium]